MTDYNHDPNVPRVGVANSLAGATAYPNEILWTSDDFRLYVEQGGAKKLVGEADFVKKTGDTISQPTIGNEVLRLESVATNDDPNWITLQARVATTDVTATVLWTETPADDKISLYEARVIARQTAGAAGTVGQGAAYIRFYPVRRISGTTTAIAISIPTFGIDMIAEDDGTWDCSFSLNGNVVELKVTGKTDETITWHATIYKQTVGT